MTCRPIHAALFVLCLLLLIPSLAQAQTACEPTFDCFGFDADPGGTRLCGTDSNDGDLQGTVLGERLCGLEGDDVLAGNDGDDLVNGNQGQDEVNGNAGNDIVRGGQGDDTVRGGQGNDDLFGDLGNDQLWGDLGNDTLTGGPGDDTFHYREGDGNDAVTDGDGNDRLVVYGISSFFTAKIPEGPSQEACRFEIFTDTGGSIFFQDRSCIDLKVFYADEGCVPDKTTLCLQNERFEVQVDFIDTVGVPGQAKVVDGVTSPDSGLFWFFDPNNWEMLVKVVDGCNFNGHYWVFAAATTNVQFDMTVTDRTHGTTYEHSNPAGTLALPVGDIEALATCP